MPAIEKTFDRLYKKYKYTVAEYDRKEELEGVQRLAKLVIDGELGEHLWYCGYVIVPKNHKYYDKGYDDIDIEAHGGLTFSGKLHLKKSAHYDMYAIGVDFMHYHDKGGTMEKAMEECKHIIDQLAETTEIPQYD